MGNIGLHGIDLEFEGDNKVTLSKLHLLLTSKDGHAIINRTFRGSSIRHPLDRNDEEVGSMLALGRAMEIAGKRLQKAAWGKVSHNEHKARMKSRQKEEKLSVVRGSGSTSPKAKAAAKKKSAAKRSTAKRTTAKRSAAKKSASKRRSRRR